MLQALNTLSMTWKKMYNLDPSTDTGAYILGILWGTMSVGESGFWVRHRDPWFVETVRTHLELSPSIHAVSSATGPQYRLKIVRAETVRGLKALLERHGWTPRKDSIRPYPSGDIDDRGFIRAWTELHSHADTFQAKRRNGTHYPQKRLRIYGNFLLLDDINRVICAGIGQSPRKLQKTTNKTTKALYFQGSSVSLVLGWLYDGATISTERR